jgi:hypothetical protein
MKNSFNLKKFLSEGVLLKEENKNNIWNGWYLGYASDYQIFIHPINSYRPWIDGVIKNGEVILSTETSDTEGLKFLQDLGSQLNSSPQNGKFDIELKIKEQDLRNLFKII